MEGTSREERTRRADYPWAAAKFAFSVASLGSAAMLALKLSRITREQWSHIFEPITNYTKAKTPPWLRSGMGNTGPFSTAPTHATKIFYYARTTASESFDAVSQILQYSTGLGKDVTDRFIIDSSLGTAMTHAATLKEIAEMESHFNSSVDPIYKKMYQREINDEVFGNREGVTTVKGQPYSSVGAALLDNPEKIEKYRHALRKSISVYNRANDIIGQTQIFDPAARSSFNRDIHAEAISQNKYVSADDATRYETAAVRWKPLQLQGTTSSGSTYSEFLNTMNGLSQRGVFHNNIIYNDLKTVMGKPLAVSNVNTSLDRLYTNLKGALKARYAHAITDNVLPDIDKLFDIRHELVDYGNKEVGIRFKIQARSLIPEDINDPTKRHILGQTSPSQNFSFEFSIGHMSGADNPYAHKVGSTSYVTNLLAKVTKDKMGRDTVEYMGLPSRFISMLDGSLNRMVDAITTGDVSRFDKVIRDATEVSISHATLSGGFNFDRYVANTIVMPDALRESPLSVLSIREKRSIIRKIDQLDKQLQSLVGTPSKALALTGSTRIAEAFSAEHKRISLEIVALNRRLDAGITTGDRLIASNRMTQENTALIAPGVRRGEHHSTFYDEMAATYPWMVSGSHPGSTVGISVFGHSLWTYRVNPQTQPYQFSNVYDIKGDKRKHSVFRWLHPDDSNIPGSIHPSDAIDRMLAGSDGSNILGRALPLLPDSAYRSESMLMVINDMYPYNQDAIVLDRKLMNEMRGNKVDSGQGSIKIPADARILDPKLKTIFTELQYRQVIDNTEFLQWINDPQRDFTIQAGTRLYNKVEGGLVRRSPEHAVRIVGVSKDAHGNIVLQTTKVGGIDDPIRVRSLAGVKSVPIEEDFTKYDSAFGSVRGIMRGSIGRKMNMYQINTMLLQSAFQDAADRRTWLMNEISQGRGTSTHHSEIARIERNLESAARKIGASYHKGTNSIVMPGIGYATRRDAAYSRAFDERMYSAVRSLNAGNVDDVMQTLGAVYKKGDPILQMEWAKSSADLRKAVHNIYGTEGDKEVDDLIDKFMTPGEGKSKYLHSIGNLWGLKVMDRLGLMRQSADEITKVYNIDKPTTMGLPFNAHYGIILSQKFANVVAKEGTPSAFAAAEKFVGMMVKQFGGEKAMSEYMTLYRAAIGMGPDVGQRVYRKADASLLLSKINKSLDSWDSTKVKLENYAPDTKLSDIGLEFDVQDILDDMKRAGVETEGILGSWLEVEHPIRMPNGQVSKHIYIPDLFKMKIMPTTVQEAMDYYAIVPRALKQLLEVGTGRAGTGYKELPNNEVMTSTPTRSGISVGKYSARMAEVDSIAANISRRTPDLLFNMAPEDLSGFGAIGDIKGKVYTQMKGKLYVDIETTGLGPDSRINMIGLGYNDNGKFTRKILFAHNIGQERGILEAFKDISKNFDEVVIYNGQRFDLGKIEARALDNGIDMTSVVNKATDIIYAISPDKLEELRLKDKKLQTLTEKFFGHKRDFEAPGSLMPALYDLYNDKGTSSKDRSEILRLMLEHNYEDLRDTAAAHAELIDRGMMVKGLPGSYGLPMEKDYGNMISSILGSSSMQAKSGTVAWGAYSSFIAQLFNKHGQFREQIFGGKFPGMQAVVSALPPDLERTLGIGPMDLAVAKNSKLYTGVKENIMRVMQTEYSKDPKVSSESAWKMAEDYWSKIETGEVQHKLLAVRHPVTGYQAMAIANLRIIDLGNEHPEMASRFMPAQLLQFAFGGDLDYDQLHVFFNGTTEMQEAIQHLAEAREGTTTYNLATDYTAAEIRDATGKVHKLPKVFQLGEITDRPGKYHVLVHDVVTDETGKILAGVKERVRPVEGSDNLKARGLKILTAEDGSNVVVDATNMIDLMDEYLKEGKSTNASVVRNLLSQIGEVDPNMARRVDKIDSLSNKLVRNQMEKFLVLQSQKGMVGSSTALVNAMDALAMMEMGPAQAALVTGANFNIVQSFLSAKKWADGQVERKLADYGRFAYAMSHVTSLDDQEGRFLIDKVEGLGMSKEAVQAYASINPTKRARLWHATTTYRNIMTSTGVNPEEAVETMAGIFNEIKSSDSDTIYGQMGIFAGLITGNEGVSLTDEGTIETDAKTMSRLTNKLLAEANLKGLHEGEVRADGTTPRAKSFWGNLKDPTNVDNTRLADALGPKWGSVAKVGALGAGAVAGLYLAFNFFRPNQMGMLGVQPGYGGEQWNYFSGSRMELPRTVPIDVGSYTWNSKRARVTPYDPALAEKMHEFRTTIRNNIVTPVVAPFAGQQTPGIRTYRHNNDRYVSRDAGEAVRGSHILGGL